MWIAPAGGATGRRVKLRAYLGRPSENHTFLAPFGLPINTPSPFPERRNVAHHASPLMSKAATKP